MLELSKIFSIKISQYIMVVIYRALHIMRFLVNTLQIPTIPTSIKNTTFHSYMIYITINIFISINFIAISTDIIYCYHHVIHCNYIVTILITTLYSYIYQYILSIKTYNSQYRYKNIESIIVISINKQ